MSIDEKKRWLFEKLNELADSNPGDLEKHLSIIYEDETSWRGSHPLNEMSGIENVHRKFWLPLMKSFPDIERRDGLFIGGEDKGKIFIGAIGHYCGTFREPWLGIPETGRTIYLRYGEFYQMGENKVAESTILIDVLDFIRQAGVPSPLPVSLGSETMWPSPLDGQGIAFIPRDEKLSKESIDLTLAMHKSLISYDDFKGRGREGLLAMSQKKYWHPKMMWYGPSGIGTTRGLQGFVDHHQLPFRTAFPSRRLSGHYVNIGDGNYSATAGWPSVKGNHLGGNWLGTSPTGKEIEMRVMDFYSREGDLIRENWVPIDITHILLQMGIDVFAKIDSFINPRKYV